MSDTPPSSRRSDIQGLRGVAVLLVVAYHAGLPVPGGFVGVDVFFVISGYVITSMLMREVRTSQRIDLAQFYARRIRRLVPALTVLTAFALVMCVLVPSPLGQPQETIKTGIGAMALAANVVLQRSLPGYFALAARDNALLHTWSLSLEEQFYLVFPSLLAGLVIVARRRPGEVAAVGRRVFGVLAVLSVGLSLVSSFEIRLAGVGLSRQFAFFSAPTRAWEFIAGNVLALSSPAAEWRREVAWLSVGLGLALIALASLVLTDDSVFPGWVAMLPVVGSVLVIAGGTGLGATPGNPLSITPLVQLGDLSYSWYLWHWPMIVFGAQLFGPSRGVIAVAALASLAPAALSFKYVETPIRLSKRFSLRASYALLATCVVFGLSVAFLSERVVHFGVGQPWSMGAHAAMQRNCDRQPIDFVRCTWGARSEERSVLLAGDSQSWALADGVIAAASQLGMTTTVAPTNGCPFVHPDVAATVIGKTCSDSIKRTLAYVARTQPSVLIVANSESYKDPAIREAYGLLLADLPEPRPVVVIVRQPPGGDDYSGRQSLLVRPGAPSRTSVEEPAEPLLTQALRVIGQAVVVVDPRDTLCSKGACDVAIDGDELYSNGNHLSVKGALVLGPQLLRAISARLR